ncbi:glycosyltransferase family 39 protein [Thermomicrobium sp.]|jgi:hypothetical protein|uniref:glycosyltransferase family 39 protein n=1 Tax=Thermomicrobium sp. TaxID=1969469 RepID=UPI001B1E0F29|nr:glycosyltransferase family 39 protein [Thermomicrobium sp.]MBO9307052.1 glycosyltransferase family 39 protein [Thermomicrobium sp.]
MPGSDQHGAARGWRAHAVRALGRCSLLGVLTLAPVVLALALYLPSLRFSFLLDDSYDLLLARETSYQDLLLRPLPGFSYYRPLTFVVYKLVHELVGGRDPWHYHALAVLLHATNVLLLGRLVRRLAGRSASTLAAALFASFPFAYQAVQIVCSLPHLLVTSCLLGALLAWLRAGDDTERRWIWCGLALLLALAAPGFHETGALAGLLLAGTLVSRGARRAWRALAPWLASALAGNGAYVALWFWGFAKPGPRAVTWWDRLQNVVFWLQAAAYPVTRQLTVLVDAEWLTRHAWSAVSVSALLALGAGLFVHGLGGQARSAAAILVLGFLLFAPVVCFLPFAGYVQDGPRLLYPVAPALATFWGMLPRAGWRWPRGRLVAVALSGLLVALALLQGVTFVARRTKLAEQASAAQEAVVAAARAAPCWPLVVVNGPAWLALHRYEYPLGHFGMNAQPSYHGYDALLQVRLGWRTPVRSLAVEPATHQRDWTFGPHGQPGTLAEVAALRLAGWRILHLVASERGFSATASAPL